MTTAAGLLIEDVSADLLPPVPTPERLPLPLHRFRQVVVHRDGVYQSTVWRALERDLRAEYPRAGFHFYVPEAPELRQGRVVVLQALPLDSIAYGAPPNYQRLLVMLGGRCNAPVPTPQRDALLLLLLHLQDTLNLRPSAVCTVADLDLGGCPGAAVQGLVQEARRLFIEWSDKG